jgi:hypothetical protein
MDQSLSARRIDEEDQVRVDDARITARWLRVMAIGAGLLGLISFIWVGWFYLDGSLNVEQAVAALVSSAFFTIFSGAAAYGSASNLDINASRMEREIKRSELARRG